MDAVPHPLTQSGLFPVLGSKSVRDAALPILISSASAFAILHQLTRVNIAVLPPVGKSDIELLPIVESLRLGT
jgi:hypothetical protein